MGAGRKGERRGVKEEGGSKGQLVLLAYPTSSLQTTRAISMETDLGGRQAVITCTNLTPRDELAVSFGRFLNSPAG